MKRDVAIKDAWDALQPWVLVDERKVLAKYQDVIEKMLARAYDSGQYEAKLQMRLALGLKESWR